MSQTPNFNLKIKSLFDSLRPEERICALTGERWFMDENEVAWYRKFNVPPSKYSPTTRLKILLGFATGISIWWNKHARTGEPILSFIHPDHPIPVISDEEWANEDFVRNEAMDPNRPFFEQMRKLVHSVPNGAMRDDGSNMRSLTVDMGRSEDLYMVFGGYASKRILYAILTIEDEDSLDISNTKQVRDGYRLNRCERCYGCRFSVESLDCMSSAFLFDCRHCESCFGGTNLRNRKYVFFNEQLSKEEYERRVGEIDLSSKTACKEIWQRFLQLMEREGKWPERFTVGSEGCSGEYLDQCVRCSSGFWIKQSTDTFHCWFNAEIENTFCTTWTGPAQDVYDSNGCFFAHDLKFCDMAWYSSNLEYCFNCSHCEFCFGCVGLKHKTFCLFNKQYSEEEYWKTVDIIKCAMLDHGEYGEYFPCDFSPSGFEYSIGNVSLGYSDEEIERFGALKFDPARGTVLAPQRIDTSSSPLNPSGLPDRLDDVDPSVWIGKPILDPVLNRPFIVTASEFDFYRRHRLPFPHQHFLSRLTSLIQMSNSPLTEEGICSSCHKPILIHHNVTFPHRSVFCQACYSAFLEKRN
ncbi:MAG TPA: hypothetical protein VJB99_02560 [Patescibacteria group bacterium]|nr:hypothetical protein [Patescibacteria group bacterium]